MLASFAVDSLSPRTRRASAQDLLPPGANYYLVLYVASPDQTGQVLIIPQDT